MFPLRKLGRSCTMRPELEECISYWMGDANSAWYCFEVKWQYVQPLTAQLLCPLGAVRAVLCMILCQCSCVILYNRSCALARGNTCPPCICADIIRCKLRKQVHQQCILSWNFTVHFPVVISLYTVDCACTIMCSVPSDLPYMQICTVQ